MPFRLTRRAFGPYTLVTLGDEETHVSFVPSASAYVHQVRLGGRDLLRHYVNGDALRYNVGHYNLALLPFPNRLRHGEYEWGGRTRRFPVNNLESGSALHGYNNDARFAVTGVDLGTGAARVRMGFVNHADDYPQYGYPFPVRFACELALDAAGTFSWSLSAENLGAEPAPLGLGWHPYFALPGGPAAWRIAMPPNRRVELAGALPTGRLLAGLPPGRPLPVDPAWDDCFALDAPATDATVTLAGPDYTLTLAQGGDTRYTQLYVPDTGDALAVEPMTCGVDAFRQNRQEVAIAPGEAVSTSLRVVLAQAPTA